jgi:hypothetical protein
MHQRVKKNQKRITRSKDGSKKGAKESGRTRERIKRNYD